MPKRFGPITRRLHVGLVTAGLTLAGLSGAFASYKTQPALASGAPLSFGMSADEASAALGVPLSTFKTYYAQEGLIVSKCACMDVKRLGRSRNCAR